jgi:hypothetical protein
MRYKCQNMLLNATLRKMDYDTRYSRSEFFVKLKLDMILLQAEWNLVGKPSIWHASKIESFKPFICGCFNDPARTRSVFCLEWQQPKHGLPARLFTLAKKETYLSPLPPYVLGLPCLSGCDGDIVTVLKSVFPRTNAASCYPVVLHLGFSICSEIPHCRSVFSCVKPFVLLSECHYFWSIGLRLPWWPLVILNLLG